MNNSICNTESEEVLVEAQLGAIKKSMKSCKVSCSDIPVPAQLWLQSDCANWMEKLNTSIEKLCGYEQFENTINYHFSEKSLILQAMTYGSSGSNKLTQDYLTLEFHWELFLIFSFHDILRNKVATMP